MKRQIFKTGRPACPVLDDQVGWLVVHGDVMDIEKALEAQMKFNKEVLDALTAVNKNLLARIEDLETKAGGAETPFITGSLAFCTASMLARDFPIYRDSIIAHCERVKPPDHLDKDAVAAGFKLLTGFFMDPDKKPLPGWFGGVIPGGKDTLSDG